MNQIATTKLSSRGQVVIPEEIRSRLGLETGVQFVVIGEGDVVILKAIHPPDMSEFDTVVERARKAARKAGLKRSDVADAIERVRREK
jgi:AbrB family looped-hinge helix DNA binding protein